MISQLLVQQRNRADKYLETYKDFSTLRNRITTEINITKPKAKFCVFEKNDRQYFYTKTFFKVHV